MTGQEHLDKAYEKIKLFYGNKTSKRSQVPLINHIDEGLLILDELGAGFQAKAAYCYHPMFQNGKDLIENYDELLNIHPVIVALIFEYRRAANAYLCRPSTDHFTEKDLPKIPLEQTRKMLIADKRQNQRDFRKYHKGSHIRSDELERYFILWLKYLYQMKD